MPTKESIRVAKHRDEHFDRINFLTEKGTRKFYKILAMRENAHMSKMIRNAVLARAGLQVMPYPNELDQVGDPETPDEARAAIRRFQHHEEADEIKQHIIEELGTEPPAANFTVTMDHADIAELLYSMKKISAAIQAAGAPPTNTSPPVTVKLKGREIGILRRFLSNVESPRK